MKKWPLRSISSDRVCLGLTIVQAKNIRLGPARLQINMPKFQVKSRNVHNDKLEKTQGSLLISTLHRPHHNVSFQIKRRTGLRVLN
jgi:hypothetical protein